MDFRGLCRRSARKGVGNPTAMRRLAPEGQMRATEPRSISSAGISTVRGG